MMSLFMHLLVASVWTFLQGNTTLGGFFIGGVAGFLLLWCFQKTLKCEGYVRRVLAVIRFTWFFLGSVLVSNWRMVCLSISPRVGERQGSFSRYDTKDLSSVEMVLLAYFINLTPGTTVADRCSDGYFILHTFPSVSEEQLKKEINTTLREPLLAFTR